MDRANHLGMEECTLHQHKCYFPNIKKFKSTLNPNSSDLSTENMQYLSSHQALADAAAFIQGMNEQYNLTDAKWIVFGASYAGTLAAWLRHKYPHLVAGVMSSSGPLNAVLDFHGES